MPPKRKATTQETYTRAPFLPPAPAITLLPQADSFNILISACKSHDYQKINDILKTTPGLLQYINSPSIDSPFHTPLHYVCKSNSPDALRCVELLIQYGADPRTIAGPEIASMPCLWLACNSGNTPIVAKLLEVLGEEATTTINTYYSAFPHTPFHRACISGNKDLIELLINHGADPTIIVGTNIKLPANEYFPSATALWLACNHLKRGECKTDHIKYLLQNDAVRTTMNEPCKEIKCYNTAPRSDHELQNS